MEDFLFKFKINQEDSLYVEKLIKDYYQFDTFVQGEDIFVKNTTRSKKPLAVEFLFRHFQFSLEEAPSVLAENLYKTINQEIMAQGKKASLELFKEENNIVIPGQLGWVSSSQEIHTSLAISFEKDKIKKIITDKLLPFVTDERINAKHVLPIGSSIYAQKFISLIKITQLVKEYSFRRVREFLDKGAHEGIGLDVNSPQKLINSLSRLGPFFFSLPFQKDGAVWHFYSNGVYNFPHLFTQSFTDTFLLRSSPRTDLSSNPVSNLTIRSKNFGAEGIWMLFAQLIEGVNNYFSFLFDPKNFLKSGKEVDLVDQLKAQGLTQLLIADLENVNYSSDFHARFSFAFQALDKIANIKGGLGQKKGDDSKIFMSLFSLKQKEKNSKILKRAIPSSRQKLLEFLLNLNEDCYTSVHNDLRGQVTKESDEELLLNRIRNLRNLHHGTFLGRNQYEDLFAKGRAFVPSKIVYFPFILVFCLLQNPKEFLKG